MSYEIRISVWPYPFGPQHVMVLSVRRPKLCLPLTETRMNLPPGESDWHLLWFNECGPQYFSHGAQGEARENLRVTG